jgi:hypothetical protein
MHARPEPLLNSFFGGVLGVRIEVAPNILIGVCIPSDQVGLIKGIA